MYNQLIIKQNTDEPFAKSVEHYVRETFPTQLKTNSSQLLDLLTDEILGTNSVRLGPKPSPEATVKIRQVISAKLKAGSPIPFSVPWGSEKPDGSSVDLAEFNALKTMECLNIRIKRHYAPGATFGIRFEDASASALGLNVAEVAQLDIDARLYMSTMNDLLNVMDFSFIHNFAESRTVTSANFLSEVEKILPVFYDYLVELSMLGEVRDGVKIAALSDLGWSAGGIKFETASYYLKQYEKRWPTRNGLHNISVLSRYFASALVRHKLGLRNGAACWFGSFIDLAFCPSPPGVDDYLSTRVLYRTLPTCFTSLHLPPWRAKGYLLINNEGRACPKLASFNDANDYISHSFTLANPSNNSTATIKSDYVLTNK